MAKKKSWREKLHTQVRDHKTKLYHILLPCVEDVEFVIKNVGIGNLITTRQIKDYLTKVYNTDSSCSRVINNVLKEISQVEMDRITSDFNIPFWRVIKNDGSLNFALRIGLENQAQLLENEGYTLMRKEGKKPAVDCFEDYLVDTNTFPAFEKKECTVRKILLANHSEIEEYIKEIPAGKLATDAHIRDTLASDFGADITCMKVAGISLTIISHATEEERAEDAVSYQEITPYWRVLARDGSLKPTFPGAPETQKVLLEKEGYKIIKKGKKYVVVDFEDYLVTL
ncbi:MAG: MGMT family protein [Candidatus Methanofastidiosia archaeon]|jgi:alkylated DNA nucleotide flippase Atl1